MCFIVNPKNIGDQIEDRKRAKTASGVGSYDGNKPMPCILTFDSARMHDPKEIASTVNKWLWTCWCNEKLGGKKGDNEDYNNFKLHYRAPKGM